MLTAAVGIDLTAISEKPIAVLRSEPEANVIAIDAGAQCRLTLRPLGRLLSLYFAVGLGPETPCKLTAAPEAIPLSPRLFPGSPLRTALPYDVYTQSPCADDGL